jgi:hypothetical protein
MSEHECIPFFEGDTWCLCGKDVDYKISSKNPPYIIHSIKIIKDKK